MGWAQTLLRRFNQHGGAWLLETSLANVSRLASALPASTLRSTHPIHSPPSIEILRDIPYLPTGQAAHRLDIYRPKVDQLLPALLYIHGGAFQILSKDTHWIFAHFLAQMGYVVFTCNYRLAPRHPYPAALRDVMEALAWVQAHGRNYGADVSKLLLSGESAGANLSLALTVASCYEDTEPWAQPLFEAKLPLQAVIPACGIFQVSELDRFFQKKRYSEWVAARLRDVLAYLPNRDAAGRGQWPLADPLLFLEAKPPQRPLPPIFAFVGTRDPLLDDTRRLGAALHALQSPHQTTIYPGEIHAFHALLWRPNTRRCWKEQAAFLARYAPSPLFPS